MSTDKINIRAGRPSAARARPTLADLADERPTIRIAFDIDREEHKKLKVYAAQNGRRITEILREMISEFNAKNS